MVNNSTNINKTNNQLSPELTEHKKDNDICIGNLGPGLGQAQKCGWVKPVNRIPTLPSWKLDLQQQYIYNLTVKNLHRFASNSGLLILINSIAVYSTRLTRGCRDSDLCWIYNYLCRFISFLSQMQLYVEESAIK